MNYGYIGANLDKLIKEYKIQNNKLIVTFLNGKKYITDYTVENENIVISKMIEQAILRDKQGFPLLHEYSGFYMFDNAYRLFLEIYAIIVSTFLCYLVKEQCDKDILRSCVYGSVTVMTMDIVQNKIDKLKQEEYFKYNIYLKIMDDINRFGKSKYSISLLKGLKKEYLPSINTLDNYSLKDLKLIEENIENLKSSSSLQKNASPAKVYKIKLHH